MDRQNADDAVADGRDDVILDANGKREQAMFVQGDLAKEVMVPAQNMRDGPELIGNADTSDQIIPGPSSAVGVATGPEGVKGEPMPQLSEKQNEPTNIIFLSEINFHAEATVEGVHGPGNEPGHAPNPVNASSEEKKFECFSCKLAFVDEAKCFNHMIVCCQDDQVEMVAKGETGSGDEQTWTFLCYACDEKFPNKTKLMEHNVACTRPPQMEAAVKGENEPVHGSNPADTLPEEMTFECWACRMVFPDAAKCAHHVEVTCPKTKGRRMQLFGQNRSPVPMRRSKRLSRSCNY